MFGEGLTGRWPRDMRYWSCKKGTVKSSTSSWVWAPLPHPCRRCCSQQPASIPLPTSRELRPRPAVAHHPHPQSCGHQGPHLSRQGPGGSSPVALHWWCLSLGNKEVNTGKVLRTVKWFTGYGFINKNDTEEDVIVHHTDLKNNPGSMVAG